MTILAETADFVIGVDSHRDTHHAAVIETRTGGLIADTSIEANAAGYTELIGFADTHTGDSLVVWAVEGCSSYAAGLVHQLGHTNQWVIEVERPARPKRQNPAKDDLIDAVRSAREAMSRDTTVLAAPRTGPERDSLSALAMARNSAVTAGAQARCQLHAAVVVAPEPLRQQFVALTTTNKIKLAVSLRPDSRVDPMIGAHAAALKSIAERCQHNTTQARELEKRMETIINNWRPDLPNTIGVGTVVAAAVLCAWSHPERFRTEAAFAMLAGTAPIPASSGQTNRHRLNPGGDRQLNKNIHTIALTRMRCDPETKTYVNRRQAEGKTTKEIRRCLKRYITRQLYKQLNNPPHPQQTP